MLVYTCFHKFHNLQVPHGTENSTFGAMFQLEKLGLVGYQKKVETCLVAHLKAIAYIYVLFY